MIHADGTDRESRLKVDVHLNGDGMLDSMAEDVREGLTAKQKRLPPKYFYDEAGSLLFEQITGLPEYYPTRAERELLGTVADDLMEKFLPHEIVELGSGSSSKTRLLLRARSARGHLVRYIPFDVSEAIVRSTADDLLHEFDFLRVHGVIGDFQRHLPLVPQPEGRRLVLFLGGTIGNFDPAERVEFLSQVRDLLAEGDRLLIGMDLLKDTATIEAAYNDSAGVTAAFNRNMLNVINRGLLADFEPEAFEHRAFFNAAESRIEMHLVPHGPQLVSIRNLGITITIEPPETIWTESSYKFDRRSAEEMLTDAGLTLERFYTNERPDQLFGLALAGLA
jgi:L-histidine N-alpha-methyltransferase